MSGLTVLPLDPDRVAAAVLEGEYLRLLEWPRTLEPARALEERAVGARRWYAARGRPFAALRRVGIRSRGRDAVTLETGRLLGGAALADYAGSGRAHALVVAGASAGPEAAAEAARLWQLGRPDEAWFLERFAVAVTESLLRGVAQWLCGDLAGRRECAMPQLSPGCGGWELAHQRDVLDLLLGAPPATDESGEPADGPIGLLPGGGLRPAHSVLAVFGITRHATRAVTTAACHRCNLEPCRYRRAPCLPTSEPSRVPT